MAEGSRDAPRYGVVDIGSNSIRLVVFERLNRAAWPLFNEKVLCGLGRGLDKTGRLNESGVESALANLARFVRLADAMEVTTLDMVATAAARDAENGAAFIAEAQKRCGRPIRLLSGEEEARLSALGVVSGMPGAGGLMGDLGGGSLELVALDRGRLGHHATLPLGPLRLIDQVESDRDKARKIIDQQLEKLDWLAKVRDRDFYPVGGAWRTLARIHMEQAHYPLHVIHHYTIDRHEAEDTARVLSRLGKRSLAGFRDVPKRRLDSLPFAALALERLLRLARPARVVFSAYGLREGLLFDRLSPAEQAADPLLSAAADLAAKEGRFGDHGELLADWVKPACRAEPAAEARLRLAACHLSDIGWREHPDYRAEQTFMRLLRLPVAGIDHTERVFIATAIAHRYGAEPDLPGFVAAQALLSEEQRQRSLILGLALRLAYSFGAPALLKRTALDRSGGKVNLLLPHGGGGMFGEAVQRRLEALGRALDLGIGTGPLSARR